MLFPCKKCVCLSTCKAVAFENIKSQDQFYKIILSKCTTILIHLKYKQFNINDNVISLKPIQFFVFSKFFGMSLIDPPIRKIIYLPRRLYNNESPCLLTF